MVGIIRKDVARLQRENNRLRNQINNLTSTDPIPFTATQPYHAGDVIIDGIKVYIANQYVCAGETITPGVNCIISSIADILNK